MDATASTQTTRALRAAGTVLAATALTVVVVSGISVLVAADAGAATMADRFTAVPMALFAVVGGLIIRRLPRNPIGWLLTGFASLFGVQSAATAVAELARGDAVVHVATWLASWLWAPAIALLALAMLHFPDGRLPSPRWRPVRGVVVAALAATMTLGASLWSYRDLDLLALGDAFPGRAGAVGQVALPLLLLAFVLAFASLARRTRSGSRQTRQQLKWLLLAVGLLAAAVVAAAVEDFTGVGSAGVNEALGMLGLVAVPVAIGIAVTRHRLYDIDRLISRGVSYAALSAILGGVYVAGVLGIGALMPGEPSDLLVAGSTLAVAGLFGPLRRRVQDFVDRRFNRSRYDATRTVEAFGARLRREVDLETIVADVRLVAVLAMQPTHLSIWVRPSGEAPDRAGRGVGAEPARGA